MNTKLVAIGLYIMLVYWLSLSHSELHSLFYPTLGAFAFLFISKASGVREVSRVAAGAAVCAVIGTLLQHFVPGVWSVLLNLLIVMWLKQLLNWNAPPLVAVSLVPYFAEPPNLWIVPVSVACTLAGLLLTLVAAELARKYLVVKLAERFSRQTAPRMAEGDRSASA